MTTPSMAPWKAKWNKAKVIESDKTNKQAILKLTFVLEEAKIKKIESINIRALTTWLSGKKPDVNAPKQSARGWIIMNRRKYNLVTILITN